MVTARELESKLEYLSLTDADIPALLKTIEKHVAKLNTGIKPFIDAFWKDYSKKLIYDQGNGCFYTKSYCKYLAKEDEYTSMTDYYDDIFSDPFSPCYPAAEYHEPDAPLMLAMDVFTILEMKNEYDECVKLFNAL